MQIAEFIQSVTLRILQFALFHTVCHFENSAICITTLFAVNGFHFIFFVLYEGENFLIIV